MLQSLLRTRVEKSTSLPLPSCLSAHLPQPGSSSISFFVALSNTLRGGVQSKASSSPPLLLSQHFQATRRQARPESLSIHALISTFHPSSACKAHSRRNRTCSNECCACQEAVAKDETDWQSTHTSSLMMTNTRGASRVCSVCSHRKEREREGPIC